MGALQRVLADKPSVQRSCPEGALAAVLGTRLVVSILVHPRGIILKVGDEWLVGALARCGLAAAYTLHGADLSLFYKLRSVLGLCWKVLVGFGSSPNTPISCQNRYVACVGKSRDLGVPATFGGLQGSRRISADWAFVCSLNGYPSYSV